MIAYHNPDDVRKRIMLSSLKQCSGIENCAKHHADKAGMKMLRKDIDVSKRSNEIIVKEKMTLQRIIITNKQLKSSVIKIHNNIHSMQIIFRREKIEIEGTDC